MSLSWFSWRVTECNIEKVIKKVWGENSKQDIDAALQKLDRLNLGEILSVGAQNLEIGAQNLEIGTQNLQISNEMKSGLFPLSNVLMDDRGTEPDLQVTMCDRKFRNGFLLQTPGRITTSLMKLDIATLENG